MVRMKLLKKMAPYNAGDVAGFHEADARQMEQKGTAVRYDEWAKQFEDTGYSNKQAAYSNKQATSGRRKSGSRTPRRASSSGSVQSQSPQTGAGSSDNTE